MALIQDAGFGIGNFLVMWLYPLYSPYILYYNCFKGDCYNFGSGGTTE